MPASWSGAMNFAGLPADVVTNFTPASQTKRSMASSFRKQIGRLTPKGASVSSRILRISALQASVSPDEVSMMPRPPALQTAEASCDLAIQPIGAWTIGYFAPVWASTRFMGALQFREFFGAE